MAEKFDVAGRLSEARPSVENVQCYVWACHLLGYQNPDMTMHPAQIRDWFSSEDGMDLHALDADCAAMKAAADAASDALGRQREQLTHLTGAWRGDGGMSAADFVRRHCDAADHVAASVRASADALAGLRDALWQIVDTKASTMTAIEDRHQGERPAWLAAAQTVNTGAGDRAAASELVDRQVKPFVDNDIRNDWLTAAHTAMVSIGDSYDAATKSMTSTPAPQFDVPGSFGGPEVTPHDDGRPPGRDTAPATAPASSSPAPAAASPAPAATAPAPAASYPAAPGPVAANPPAAQALPATAGGMPAMPGMPGSPLGQLNGLPQRLVDSLAGLTSPAKDLLHEPGGDPPKDPLHHPDSADEESAKDKPKDNGHKDKPAGDHKTSSEKNCDASAHLRDGNVAPEPVAVDAPAPPPPQEPPPPPPPPSPPQPPPPPADPKTPCEIAADELPQAGQ